MFKKILSFMIAMPLFAAALNLTPFAPLAEGLEGEKLLEPVYVMDFNPDADGKFYDSPEGTMGRMEATLKSAPVNIVNLTGDSGNTGDLFIAASNVDNSQSNIKAARRTADNYALFSKREENVNIGAIGETNDYCIKAVDASSSRNTAITINFPKSYGGTDDQYRKYRFEMDWKWQQYHESTKAPIDNAVYSGAQLLSFTIGNAPLESRSKSSAEASDFRGAGALYFTDTPNSRVYFGLNDGNQTTAEENKDKITKSAETLPASESGKWQHITVDFDFGKGTIDAVIEGEQTTRALSTRIEQGQEYFDKGLSGIVARFSTAAGYSINFYDNVKLTPIAPMSDEEKMAAATSSSYTFDDIKGNNTDAANVTENLVLPSQKSGVTVTWSVEPEAASQYIDLSSGGVIRPLFTQGDQTITLTPTYTVGQLTQAGEPISGIVLKAAEASDFPLDAAYFMDFSPDADGEFYDLPQGTPGRTQVTRAEIPGDAVFFPEHTAADNKSILNSETNVSKIKPNLRTLNEFVVFSKGSAVNDVNTGASGAADDYCLKMIDTGSSAPNVNITFPEAYGNPGNGNDYVRYRFEMDYKWQQYNADLTTTSNQPPVGTTWIRFHFGENTMNLYSKNASESTGDNADASGGNALCFTGDAFGMSAANQKISADENGRNVTAAMLPWSVSGNWVHIAVDFDFEDGTIDAVIEGNGNTRIIKTVIPEGTGTGETTYRSLFMEGLTGITIYGATGSNFRTIWADNVKVSPMQTVKKTPSQKLSDANNPPTAFEDIKGANTEANNVTEALNLISKKDDVDVTWSVSPSAASRFVNVKGGAVTRPVFAEGNQSVSLTPTYTVAGRTLIGEAIDIVIAALPETAQEKIERIITTAPFVFDDIKGSNTASTAVSADLQLPKSAEDDVAVSWNVLPAEMAGLVDVATGKVTRPKYTDGDKIIKLVPTYQLEEIEMTGNAIEITVLKTTLDQSGADIQDAYAITADDLVRTGQSPERVTGNLILPKTGKLFGSSISWSAVPGIVDTDSGTVKRPFGASEKDVVLTAAVTSGGETTVRQFTVTVVDSDYGSGSSSSGGGRRGGGGGGGIAYTGKPALPENLDNTTAPNSTVFDDIDHVEWAKNYIIALYDLGVINGDGSGAFSPDRNVTREEFVKMLLLTFEVEIEEASRAPFDDVRAGSWFEPYVATASRLKLVNGISGTEFGTGRSISRQDMAAMIMRCLESKGITLDSRENNAQFEDRAEISGYAREAVENLRKAGILNGDADQNFNPNSFAKRAEVAKVLGMLIKAAEENLK